MGCERMTSAIPMHYQQSNQASWELVTLLVRNIPVDDANEYMKDHTFELRRKIQLKQL